MKTRFMAERRAFDWLRDKCSTEARQEYEKAISELVRRYNTTIHENRFIVGGAVEVFTCALLRTAGVACDLYADQTKSGDLLLPNDRKLSVKATFTGGLADVKLINQMGPGARQWDTATLFVFSDVGLVFGAPDMVEDVYVQSTGDGVILKKAALQKLVDDPANVIPMAIVRKPPTVAVGHSRKASTAVASQILRERGLTKLQKAFPEAASRSA